MRQAVDHLTREELDGFLIHLDADCLVALASGKAVGLEITIYNPRLDEGGSAGRGLADVLAAALGAAAS